MDISGPKESSTVKSTKIFTDPKAFQINSLALEFLMVNKYKNMIKEHVVENIYNFNMKTFKTKLESKIKTLLDDYELILAQDDCNDCALTREYFFKFLDYFKIHNKGVNDNIILEIQTNGESNINVKKYSKQKGESLDKIIMNNKKRVKEVEQEVDKILEIFCDDYTQVYIEIRNFRNDFIISTIKENLINLRTSWDIYNKNYIISIKFSVSSAMNR